MLRLIAILLLMILELFSKEHCPQPNHNSYIDKFAIDSNNYQQCLNRIKIEELIIEIKKMNENMMKIQKSIEKNK